MGTEGFLEANVSTALLDDPKFRRLLRNANNDADLMSHAVVVYTATVLASWRQGERVTAEDAAPPWVTDIERHVQGLQAVGLLDAQGKVMRKAWAKRFEPARQRRDEMREQWRERQRRHRGVTSESRVTHGGVTTSYIPTDRQTDSPPRARGKGPGSRPQRVNEGDLPDFLRAVQ